VQKFNKKTFLITNITQFFPLTQSKSIPDPEFMKQVTGRIQSRLNKIRHNPGPIQVQFNAIMTMFTVLQVSQTQHYNTVLYMWTKLDAVRLAKYSQ